jgi:hypothetical protein
MDNTWSDDVEHFLNAIRINSMKLSEFHRINYLNLKNKIKYFRVPTLILSAVNSVFSVGLSAFVAQSTVSVLNCLISLICGIIVSIELFLQVQSRMDQSNSLSKDFYIISTDIYKTLSLERDNRRCDPFAYMEEKFSEFSKFKSSSELLSVHLRDELETVPLDRTVPIYATPKPKIVDQCAVDIDYYPDFQPASQPGSRPNSRQSSRKSSEKVETPLSVVKTPLSLVETPLSIVDTPLSVVDILPEMEIPTRPASNSLSIRTPGASRASSRRPSNERVEIIVRDIETGQVVTVD